MTMQLSSALRVDKGAVVAFTGAGGKTTAMLRLGRELAARGLTVLATTTTRVGLDELHRFPGFLIQPDPPAISAMLAKTRFLFLARGLDSDQGKARGFEPEQIERFRDLADVVLVEADGARGLLLKAPADHEPAIPSVATHVVCCLNLAALGRPLGPDVVHRPQRVARLTGLSMGDVITPAALARLALHAEGPARGAPAHARRALLLNGADAAAGDWEARLDDWRSASQDALQTTIARLAASPDFASVLLAQVAHEPPVLAALGKTAAIVLAAGASTRFGSPKQLHPWRGQPLLRQVVLQALAAPVQRVIVVLGAYFDAVAPVLAGLPVWMVYNPNWEQGQSASMQAGLAAAGPDIEAALFMLGDQPRQPADVLHHLVNAHRRTRAAIVAPRHRGRRGNPVLFDRALFPELMQVTGDQGGRALFERYQDEILWVEAGEEVLEDVDRPGQSA
ncbi:MAG: putative selenium-dependent hydroxylase accessory protein YqeC [Chloroflexi bacterium]|nr:putative selenium-dependent hydroxylase accessory protein YqeC [Chloroflexota bacterium]